MDGREGNGLPGYLTNPNFGSTPLPDFGNVDIAGVSVSYPVPGNDPGEKKEKKKRGRPRKYGPEGATSNTALALSPVSSTLTEKNRRGRPPGSGRKQQLASLGGWMYNSAGVAFTPHVMQIAIGEDIAARVLSFAQQRPRALCILSANGAVSTLTLHQPSSSNGTVTYEGRFEILCLSGSYLLSESGEGPDRTGGLSISVCSPNGQVIGGGIGGTLIAATLVQVTVCSFVYGGGKAKTKTEASTKDEKDSAEQINHKSPLPANAAPNLNITPNQIRGGWPSSSQPDMQDPPHTEIDLSRG